MLNLIAVVASSQIFVSFLLFSLVIYLVYGLFKR